MSLVVLAASPVIASLAARLDLAAAARATTRARSRQWAPFREDQRAARADFRRAVAILQQTAGAV